MIKDELYCRPYSAGFQLPFSDKIQNLQNCYTTPNNNTSGGIGVFIVPSSITIVLFPHLIRGYLRDDVAVILLLGVSFTGIITTAKKSCWHQHLTTQPAETDSLVV